MKILAKIIALTLTLLFSAGNCQAADDRSAFEHELLILGGTAAFRSEILSVIYPGGQTAPTKTKRILAGLASLASHAIQSKLDENEYSAMGHLLVLSRSNPVELWELASALIHGKKTTKAYFSSLKNNPERTCGIFLKFGLADLLYITNAELTPDN